MLLVSSRRRSPRACSHCIRLASLIAVARVAMALIALSFLVGSAKAEDAKAEDAKTDVDQVVTAAGGEEKLLKLFRFRERVLISDKAPPPPAPDEKGNRTSVVEIGGDWWVGAAKRDKDKVRVLVWAWSLRLLLDPKSKVESLGEAAVAGKPAFGLRVTGSVKEPVDLYFDAQDKRLACIDYTDTRHVVSEWKKTDAGHHYAARTIGYRFADRAKKTVSEKPWYQTDILELTPLAELPADLKR